LRKTFLDAEKSVLGGGKVQYQPLVWFEIERKIAEFKRTIVRLEYDALGEN